MNFSHDHLPDHDRLLEHQYIELPDELAAHFCGGTSVEVYAIPDVTLKRGTFGTNYFDGRFLRADDLKAEQGS